MSTPSFLSTEYFRQDLLAAPTQDVRLNKMQADISLVEEEEEMVPDTLDESMTAVNQDVWKSTKQKRKEMKRAPNK